MNPPASPTDSERLRRAGFYSRAKALRKGPLSLFLASALLLGACSNENGFGGSYFAPTAALVCPGVNCVKIPESKISEQLTAILADDESAKSFRGPDSAKNRVDAQREILSGLIRDEVVVQRALKMKITAKNVQSEADGVLADLQAQFPSEQAFASQMEAEGLTMDQLKGHLVTEAIIGRVQQEVGKDAAATPAEVEQFYNLNRSQYEEQVNISHILVCGNLNAQERSCSPTPEDDTRAADALRRARAGEDFGALVREYSVDESSKALNGEIGYISRGDLVPELETAAFSLLVPGEVSEPIKSQFGLHIVRLNNVGKSLDEAREDIEEGLTQRKQTKAFDEWIIAAIKDADIRVNNKIGQYDPISQTVVSLDAQVEQTPAARSTGSPAEVPDPPAAPDEAVVPEVPPAEAPAAP